MLLINRHKEEVLEAVDFYNLTEKLIGSVPNWDCGGCLFIAVGVYHWLMQNHPELNPQIIILNRNGCDGGYYPVNHAMVRILCDTYIDLDGSYCIEDVATLWNLYDADDCIDFIDVETARDLLGFYNRGYWNSEFDRHYVREIERFTGYTFDFMYR